MAFCVEFFLNHLKIKSFYLKCLFVFLSIQSFGQENCKCETLKIENKSALKNDSILLFQKIEKLKNSTSKICKYEALNLEFNFYNNQQKTREALIILQRQEVLHKSVNCDNDFLFKLLYNKARYYHATNDFENLSDFAFKALTEAERLKDSKKKIESIQEIVYLFTRINEDDKNWSYIKSAEKLILDLNPELYPHYYSWLAYEYENKYAITERKTLIDSTLLFINEAKKGAFKHQLFNEITKCYRVEEACAYHKGELQKALAYADSAIYYGKKIKDYKNLSSLYLSKAWDHFDLGQLEEANKWMDTALAESNSNNAAKMMLYSEAAQIFEGTGKLDKAYASFKAYSKLKDSILDIDKVKKINELEQKYQKAENESKIFKLEKAKQLYLLLIIGSLLVILSLVFFFRQRALKNKQKILETEQRLNRARINPHFFFNAMASLQNVAIQEKSSKTTLYTSRLAKIMRQSLESTYEELTTIEEEIDFLTQYLEIQKLRFPEKFNYQFQVDENLEINELKLPGMLTQPFIENAIEHGFKDIDYKGELFITFKEENKNLLVIIEDNGKGNNVIEIEKKHKSRAMQIIKDRLFLFNKQHKLDAFYEVEQAHGKGFKIKITLPKLY